jgi:hypothetical protein
MTAQRNPARRPLAASGRDSWGRPRIREARAFRGAKPVGLAADRRPHGLAVDKAGSSSSARPPRPAPHALERAGHPAAFGQACPRAVTRHFAGGAGRGQLHGVPDCRPALARLICVLRCLVSGLDADVGLVEPGLSDEQQRALDKARPGHVRYGAHGRWHLTSPFPSCLGPCRPACPWRPCSLPARCPISRPRQGRWLARCRLGPARRVRRRWDPWTAR